MIYRTARITRALRARIEQGEELGWALAELARWEKLDAALVRGTGVLAAAVLERAEGGPVALDGPLGLEALGGSLVFRDGRLEVSLRAVLTRGGAVVAGSLREARAEAVDLVVDVLDDTGPEWTLSPTGRSR